MVIIMLYPIKFTPVYKSKIWGGTKLNEVYGREIPGTDIGEAWEITCRDDGMSVIANGDLQGMSFSRLLETYGAAIVGRTKIENNRFPLLLKLLDVNSDLSVQVHPTIEYIEENNLQGEEEKNEMWYVLYAEDTARMVSGIKPGVTKEKLEEAIAADRIEDYLKVSPVKTGDVIMIKAGNVHAACAGMLLFELQQSSDTTYRLYDYKRKDSNGNERRLDVDKALGTINYNDGVNFVKKPEFIEHNSFAWRRLIKNKYFTLDELRINGRYIGKTRKNFCIMTCIKGSAVVRGNWVNVDVCEGESVLMPACIDVYTVTGECTMLCSSVNPPVSYA